MPLKVRLMSTITLLLKLGSEALNADHQLSFWRSHLVTEGYDPKCLLEAVAQGAAVLANGQCHRAGQPWAILSHLCHL